jgi:ADP-ribosylglycohydrolase
MINHDKILGSLYGVAMGDAMGRPTEFMSLAAINTMFGDYGRLDLPRPALFTDDTQMTLAVAWAMISARGITPRELVRTLTNEFIEWRHSAPPRAPGMSCISSINQLKLTRKYHKSWTMAPVLSKGCGANMRVMATALLPSMDLAVNASQLQAALTHGHPEAIVSTELTALAIRWAAEDVDLIELPSMLGHRAFNQRHVYRHDWLGNLYTRWDVNMSMLQSWNALEHMMYRVGNALNMSNLMDACEVLGQAWHADQALATGLYYAIRYEDDPQLAISMAARTNGDSDSIASIAGAILGAKHGVAAWPVAWQNRIESADEIRYVANALADLKK